MPSTDDLEYITEESASTYWKLAEAYGHQFYKRVAAMVTTDTDPNRVLDVGTGPGILPRYLSEHVDAEIDAFDRTRPLVAYGAQRHDATNFIVADVYHIPVQDTVYDLVTCTGVFHALDNPVDMLNEVYRVLTPNGEAWLFDPTDLVYDDAVDDLLTDEEFEIWEQHREETNEGTPETYTKAEAERLLTASRFSASSIWTEEDDSIRIRLVKNNDSIHRPP